MKKSRSKIKSPTAWIDKVAPDDVAKAFEEATMDCHDEDEQLSGLVTCALESLEFPFAANVLGLNVQVVDAEAAERNAAGINLIVERDGLRHRIAAQRVMIQEPFPGGIAFLAAFLDWRKKF